MHLPIPSLSLRAADAPRSTANGQVLGEPRLKVAMLAACPFPANHGTPGSIRELSEATADRGHEVHVVTYHFGEDIPLRGVHLHRIPNWTGENAITVGPTRNRPLYDMLLVYRAIQVVRKYRVDVIHAHGYEAAVAAALCRLVTGRPFIYSAHNTMGDELASYDFFRSKWAANKLAWVLDRTVPRLGNRCIPHSHNMVEFLADRGLESRTEDVVHWGIDLDEIPVDEGAAWRAHYGLGRDPIVLYAGVMDKFQRLDLLLDAMQQVVERIPNAKLVFVVTVPCEAHERAIRDRAHQLGIEGNIILTQPQDMTGSLRHLWMADVTVVPRPQTPGFPIKLLNYMATRRPCVMFASSVSGVTHGEHIWQVTPDTPNSLADGILHLLHDPNLRSRLAENAFDFVSQHHDRRQLARNVSRAYLKVLEGTRRGREIKSRTRVATESDILGSAATENWNES